MYRGTRLTYVSRTVGIAIVFDYVGQLREERDLEADEERKAQPTWMVTAPAQQPRTTYDPAPYDPPMPMQGGWVSAKTPNYAFTTPQAQAGSARQ